MRIGLFGGTFDPIHWGHLRSAEEVSESFDLNKVYFIPAAVPPHKGELNLLRDYYLAQVAKSGVAARLGEAPDAAAIAAARPDAVIVATGSRPRVPEIPGCDGPNVVFAEDVLLGKAATGPRVVVIGGEMVGCETAEHLAKQGKQVTLARRGAMRRSIVRLVTRSTASSTSSTEKPRP